MHIKKKYRRRPPQTGEAGFTLIEMVMVIVLASILGMFVLGMLTKSIVAQRDMQVRKESNDDAIRSMDKITRELREASMSTSSTFFAAQNNFMKFQKATTSYADNNLYVMYVLMGTTLIRRSAPAQTGPWVGVGSNSSVIATNVKTFNSFVNVNNTVTTQYVFESAPGANDGSEWVSHVLRRN